MQKSGAAIFAPLFRIRVLLSMQTEQQKERGTRLSLSPYYRSSFLCVDMKVSDPSLLGVGFATNGKESIVVRNLLLHNAGFPPDPNPNYCK